jgi:hypothetical protein
MTTKAVTTSKAPDLSELIKPYENKWVAFSSDYRQVLAAGDTLREVDEQLEGVKKEEAVFHKVLPFDADYVPQITL